MPPWAQRLITVVTGIAIGAVGVLLPPAAPFTTPAATMVIGWAIAHPADAKKD